MTFAEKRLDAVRKMSNDSQNRVIDSFMARRIDRRSFIRWGSAVGIGVPMLSTVLTACGHAPTAGSGASKAIANAGTLRGAIVAPTQKIDPWRSSDSSNVTLSNQVGEYLALSTGEPELKPVLAESWESNDDGTTWRFNIRKGVKFNDGKDLRAADVAYTFNTLADPNTVTSASAMLGGVLSPGGANAIDDHTVVFELDQAAGLFPWLVSSDNFNAIILPENYDGDWSKDWVGTGPWVLEEYAASGRTRLIANPEYWGKEPVSDAVEFQVFEDEAALVLALQGAQLDFTPPLALNNTRGIIERDEEFNVSSRPSARHDVWTFRVDQGGPLADKRVRQALAHAIDRKDIIENILLGHGAVGNDSPIAEIHPSYDSSVPQREFDIAKARKLLSEAGYDQGFEIEITAMDYQQVPSYAQYIQSALKEISVDVKLNVLDTQTFWGDNTYGSSPQLDSQSTINNWGHRGIPNVFLTGQLSSTGNFNAPHYKDREFDDLLKDLVQAIDPESQVEAGGRIQEKLLDDTPAVYAYFPNLINVAQKSVGGVQFTGFGNPLVAHAGKAA